MFKKYIMAAVYLAFALFLTGCHHDEKQAANIYQQIEKSANLEKKFADGQQQLQSANKKEIDIYNKLLNYNISDKKSIKSSIQSASQLNKKQEKLLQSAEKDFNKAYKQLIAAVPYIADIKDDTQRKAAKTIIKLAKKRKQQLDAYFQNYTLAIKRNDQLYDDMTKQKYAGGKLDKQITKMNAHYHTMKQDADTFNQTTRAYNKAKSYYYQLAELDANTVKQAQS